METVKSTVLSMLRHGSYTTKTLAYEAHAPEPSIRRIIQELRQEGHNIQGVSGYRTLRQLVTD